MKIIDGFTFYNELDLLEYRLEILYEVVDFFILVESTHTHSGKEKPLFFTENKERYSKYQNKIIHIVVEDMPFKYPNIDYEKREQWKNENFQRDAITRGLNKIDKHPDDLLIVSDLDEIPDPRLLENLKKEEVKTLKSFLAFVPVMDLYFYNLNSKVVKPWLQSRIINLEVMSKLHISPNTVRELSIRQLALLANGGWHLSFFGDTQMIRNKLQTYARQEANTESLTDPEKIQARIDKVSDPHDSNSEMVYISVKDNPNLPPRYETLLAKFYKKD